MQKLTGAPLPRCFRYLPGWVERAEETFAELVDLIDWERRDITIAGRTMPIPRLTCWMGEATYVYSGISNPPKQAPQPIVEIQRRLSDEFRATFNSCLANLYRDGQDSIGYHSDDEPGLGARPVIASVSLGDRRRFTVREVGSGERWQLDLGHGDLLLMSEESQSDYRHAVPKTRTAVGPRMNLTFRHFAQP
jgi:alkylated DNA repair dioxygenase AlkB